MTTFNTMIAAIADDLDDTNNEYLLQIRQAILAAIRFCERENFYFNEMREVTFQAKKGQPWYGSESHSDIATLVGSQAVYCQKTSGSVWCLQYETAQKLEILDGMQTLGRPQKYSYFGQKLRLYPRPDQDNYQIRLQLAPGRLAAIVDFDEKHPWFIQAFDLIFARAKYEIYKNILKDASQAAITYNDFQEQLQVLRVETSRRKGVEYVHATVF